jgi:hypothetical protein
MADKSFIEGIYSYDVQLTPEQEAIAKALKDACSGMVLDDPGVWEDSEGWHKSEEIEE